jgi:hypothetical protein
VVLRRSTQRGWLIIATAVAAGLVLLLLTSGGEDDDASLSKTAQVIAKPARATCTRTLGPRMSLARALAKAQPGAVLCLRDGSYRGGRIPAAATAKTDYVTVRPVPGQAPVIKGELAFDGARYLRLTGLAFRGGLRFAPAASNVQLIGNNLTGVGGIFFFGDSRQGGSIDSVLIQGNFIHDIDYSGSQGVYRGYGIKSIGSQREFTVRGNTIKSVAADYLQTDVADDWTVEGNRFLGPSLVRGHPQEHQDLWQIYAGGRDIEFTNNVARNTGTSQSLLLQMSYPGNRFAEVVVANNLFDHDSRGYSCQIYQSAGLVFRDNTIVGSRLGCLFRHDERFPEGSGYEVANNVFADIGTGSDIGIESSVLGWGTFDFNVSSDRSATGLGSVRGWRPRWTNTVDYQPLGLPFLAGYRPG